MNAKDLKKILTMEQIVKLLEILGAEVRDINEKEMCCKTICHDGDSHKLYFYKDSLQFYCYTNCGSMDIIQVVANHLNCNVAAAISYICERLSIRNTGFKYGFNNEVQSADLELFNNFGKTRTIVKTDIWKEFSVISDKYLNQYYDFYHESFYEDGISIDVLKKYEIKYDILNQRVIIPHRNHVGELISVRCRNLDTYLVEKGFKYMPIKNGNKILSAPTSQYFYGFFQNHKNIMKAKKVILVESEKAVMQYETMYPNQNITLALSSSNLSNFQIEYLKQLGVEEVILALDKEFEVAGSKQEKLYSSKIKKSIIDRLNFCTVTVIWDSKGLIEYKDSPLDKGKETFNKLMNDRIFIKT